MDNKAKLKKYLDKQGMLVTATAVKHFGWTRAYVVSLFNILIDQGFVVKYGSTRAAVYYPADYAIVHPELWDGGIKKILSNKGLEEDLVYKEILAHYPAFGELKENIQKIFYFAFTEMLNNAIEHSRSPKVSLQVAAEKGKLIFVIEDAGIGVFKNIKQKKKLASDLEAAQELMKGKTTTMPEKHSGQGIFWTSKMADVFIIDSYDYQLLVNNEINDQFLNIRRRNKRGTRVAFYLSLSSDKSSGRIFEQYTKEDEITGLPEFAGTLIKLKHWANSDSVVSRSEARRLLLNLDKFKFVTIDFKGVKMVGQGFADEVFGLFPLSHPEIEIKYANADKAIEQTIKRAIQDSRLLRAN